MSVRLLKVLKVLKVLKGMEHSGMSVSRQGSYFFLVFVSYLGAKLFKCP